MTTEQGTRRAARVAVVDLDGTLVDSVYRHAVLWQDAFRQVGMVIPAWRIHRVIGMSGDRLVEEVAGEVAERAIGDQVRELHDRHYAETLDDMIELDGASELLERLRSSGVTVVVASSAEEEITKRSLALLEGRDAVSASVSGTGADRSKPAPDLMALALEAVGAEATDAVAIGDTVWDVRAARDGGLQCIGLLTGGITEADLREAGAGWVFDSPRELAEGLGTTPLG